MEKYDVNIQQGGVGAVGVRLLFQSYGAGDATLWIVIEYRIVTRNKISE